MPARRILVVDDSALIREVAKVGLSHEGWDVLLARSGEQALELAARERPDAILLDVVMPDLDGPATLAELRAGEATREIPVVFLTAKADQEEDRAALAETGVDGVLAKPFDPIALSSDLAATLGWEP